MSRLWLLLVTACGRIGFDAGGAVVGDGLGNGGEGSGDARGPSLCAGQSVLLCDGFEQSTFDPRWMPMTTGATITIDSVHTYRGASSAHVSLNAATAANHPTSNVSTFDGLSGVTAVVYGRVWAYLPSPFTPAFTQMFVLTAGSIGIAFGTSNANLMVNDFSGGIITESTTAMPLDRWVCLTFVLPVNQTGMIQAFVDGQEIGDLSIAKPAAVAFDRIWIGADFPASPVTLPTTDVWLDELVVDDAPVTCAQ